MIARKLGFAICDRPERGIGRTRTGIVDSSSQIDICVGDPPN